jgi:hypothetical protein
VVGFLVPNTMVTVFSIDHGLDVGGYFGHWGFGQQTPNLLPKRGGIHPNSGTSSRPQTLRSHDNH